MICNFRSIGTHSSIRRPLNRISMGRPLWQGVRTVPLFSSLVLGYGIFATLTPAGFPYGSR